MQIGLNLSTSAAAGSDPAADGRRAEAAGFDFVCASDHLHGDHPTYETWTMLTWIAAATERVRVVSNVLGLPYRNPAVLAKMAETLQRLSGGRLVLGLGAGGWDREFEAFGLGVRTPSEKVDGLEDALHILQGLWSQPELHFDGHLYRADGARIEPKPEQAIPVWTGAIGPRSLRLLGRLADGWLPSMPMVPPEQVLQKRDVIRRAAADAGRDPDTITYGYNISVRLGARADDDRLVSGSPDEVTSRLQDLISELGLTAINIWPAGDDPAQAEAFAHDVLPHLR